IAVESVNRQYVADPGGLRIWAIDSTNGSVTLTPIAGTGNFGHSGDNGPALNADIGFVFGLTLDANKENLYFGELSAELGDGSVRRIHLPTGVITTPFE